MTVKTETFFNPELLIITFTFVLLILGFTIVFLFLFIQKEKEKTIIIKKELKDCNENRI